MAHKWSYKYPNGPCQQNDSSPLEEDKKMGGFVLSHLLLPLLTREKSNCSVHLWSCDSRAWLLLLESTTCYPNLIGLLSLLNDFSGSSSHPPSSLLSLNSYPSIVLHSSFDKFSNTSLFRYWCYSGEDIQRMGPELITSISQYTQHRTE